MSKKIAILGCNGYIGTALYFHLAHEGYVVAGIDNNLRSRLVEENGSKSIVEKKVIPHYEDISTLDYGKLKSFLNDFQPDAIVHLAEQPSAPYSMSGVNEAGVTQQNNVVGTLNVLWAMREVCPDAHLIKLGTEGEYPDMLYDGMNIPEGSRIKVDYKQPNGEVKKNWEIPTPHYAGSFYHFSKVFDSLNIDYACRIWGLKATDINQGVVYGNRYGTRFDYDDQFGTCVHRFVAQAIAGEPLTVYGTGGQTRGYICLQNSLEAIQLLIEDPVDKGEFRVIHQTTQELSVLDIANKVQNITGCEIGFVDNPRVEREQNTFDFDTSTLDKLGLKKIDIDDELPNLIRLAIDNKDRIDAKVMKPRVKWQDK